MNIHSLSGLSNYIKEYFISPLLDHNNDKNELEKEQGIELRYLRNLVDDKELNSVVHKKVVEKLADRIADSVVNRIMLGIELQRSKEDELIGW